MPSTAQISTSMEQSPHLVVCVMGAWGHIRPMLGFLARLVRHQHGGVITLITARSFSGRIEKEWARHFSTEEIQGLEPLRLRFLEKSEVFRPEDIRSELGPLYSAIIDESGIPHPTAFLTEAISATTPQLIRELSLRPIKFLVWCPTSMNLIYNILNKVENLDGILETIETIAKDKSVSFGEAANQFVTSEENINSQAVNMPDLPPVSGYELFPQEPPFLIAFGDFFIGCMRVLATCDGIVTASSYVVEPKACDSVAQMLLKRNNGNFFAVGPLDATHDQAKVGEIAQSEVAQTVEAFLDGVLQSKGPKSLLYISFGSLFGPTEPEKFLAWVEVVAEMDIPMILVVPAGVALPDSLRDSTSSRLICQWAPQQFILSHPATGAFLTHNGSNGTHESLSAGIPMISWPFSSDQPIFAMIVEQVLKVGFELNEVRRGHGLYPRLSNRAVPIGTIDAVKREARDVLTSMFLDTHSRAKMEERLRGIQGALRDTWTQSTSTERRTGSAIADIDRFINVYLTKIG